MLFLLLFQGSNNREIFVMVEGLQEPNIVDAAYTDHLASDETKLLNLQLREHANNKRTIGYQTEKVLIFHTLKELNDSSQLYEQTTATEAEKALHCQNKDILSRLDKLEMLILRNLNK